MSDAITTTTATETVDDPVWNEISGSRLERPSETNDRIARALAEFDDLRVDYRPQVDAVAALDRIRLSARYRAAGRPCGGAMLVAPFGTGKTCAVEMLVAHAQNKAEPGTTPVLAVQVSVLGTTDSVPTSILHAMRVPRPEVGNEKARWHRAVDELCRAKVELVVFDEFDRAYRRATMSAPIVRSIREWIMDASVAAVAFVGCEAAQTVLRLAPETVDRLDDEIDLSPLDWIVEEDREILLGFLERVDRELVSRRLLRSASGLGRNEVAEALCEATNGRIRTIMKVLRHAMTVAIERGSLTIEQDDLHLGADLHCVRKGYCSINPFDRG